MAPHKFDQQLSHQDLMTIFNRMVDIYYRLDTQSCLTIVSPSVFDMLGYTPDEILGHPITEYYWDADERIRYLEQVRSCPQGRFSDIESCMRHKNGSRVWVSTSGHYNFDAQGNLQGGEGIARNITDRVMMEEQLRKEAHNRIEALREIEEKNREIDEMNTTLRVILKEQLKIKNDLQEQMSAQLRNLIFPYMKLLEKTDLDDAQKEYLQIITTHLHNISGTLVHNLSNPLLNLTPREILVADQVRQGKTTAEIAKLLGLSVRTVESYRNSLRKKFHLTKKKTSLKAYLLSTFRDD